MEKRILGIVGFVAFLAGIVLVVIGFNAETAAMMDFLVKLGFVTLVHGLAIAEGADKMDYRRTRPRFGKDPAWLVILTMFAALLMFGGVELGIAFFVFDAPIHPGWAGASLLAGFVLALCLDGEEGRYAR